MGTVLRNSLLLALLLILLLGCETRASKDNGQRFVPFPTPQKYFDGWLALDTKNGQLCKTWPWRDGEQGFLWRLNGIPECKDLAGK